MKVSKNAQILFTLMFITCLVSTGFPWTISGHNVFLQPPEDGDWIISKIKKIQPGQNTGSMLKRNIY